MSYLLKPRSKLRLRTGHDGYVDNEPDVYSEKASTYSYDQVDGDTQEKREETVKVDIDRAPADDRCLVSLANP